MMRARCLSLLSLVLASTSLASATPSTADADLRAELMPLAQRIFASAFLTCDEDALRASMSEDLEFYHDVYGLIAGDLDTFIASFC